MKKSLLGRLRHAWTKNDGKLWEQWEPGPDLKDLVLRTGAVVTGAVAVIVSVLMMQGLV